MFELPAVTSTSFVFGMFISALFVFHGLFVWLYPLGKRGWRTVDYLWLSVTAVGLIGATAQGRELLANNFMKGMEQALVGWYDPLFDFVQPPGRRDVACTQFVPSLYTSLEQARLWQQEQDKYCAWYKGVEEVLGKLNRNVGVVDRKTFPAFPVLTGPVYGQYQKDFESGLQMHNEFLAKREALEAARKRSDGEELVVILSPTLIAIALALDQSSGDAFRNFVRMRLPSHGGKFPNPIRVWNGKGKERLAIDFADVLWSGFRCGILHETHVLLYGRLWGVPGMFNFEPSGYCTYVDTGRPCPTINLNPGPFVDEVLAAFDQFITDLKNPTPLLRENFKKKFIVSYGIDIGREP